MPRRLEELKADFLENGWIVTDLPDRGPLDDAAEALLQGLRGIIGNSEVEFSTHHEYITSDEHNIAVQAELTEIYREGGHARRIVNSHLELMQEFVGLDICIQRCPYLRIARPNATQDNIDFHRDTLYGGSPYESSFFVPFLDLCEESSLRVISGSHIAADQDYPTQKTFNPKVKMGTIEHKLGLPYAPHHFTPPVDHEMESVPVKYGQVLFFNLALVHGQKCNTSRLTRFSTDIRLVNCLAPIVWKRNVNETFYEPLCNSEDGEQALHFNNSPVKEQARRYIAANDLASQAN